MKQETRETQSQKYEVRTCCYACKLLETLVNKIDLLGLLVKRPEIVKNYHYYGSYTENKGPTTYNGPVNSDMGSELVNNQKDDDGQVSAPVMPHAKVDVDNERPQEDKNDDDSLVVVSKCFKFTSEFTKGKVEAVMNENYHGSHAELALIEVALYDHGQLKRRNAHTPFIRALVAWGIIKIANEDELELIRKGMTDKFRRIPDAGYKDWGDELLNDRVTCDNIGKQLGDTMPYIR